MKTKIFSVFLLLIGLVLYTEGFPISRNQPTTAPSIPYNNNPLTFLNGQGAFSAPQGFTNTVNNYFTNNIIYNITTNNITTNVTIITTNIYQTNISFVQATNTQLYFDGVGAVSVLYTNGAEVLRIDTNGIKFASIVNFNSQIATNLPSLWFTNGSYITTGAGNQGMVNILGGLSASYDLIFKWTWISSAPYQVLITDNGIQGNGTNCLVTLPNGTNGIATGKEFKFRNENIFGSFIITNATGDQYLGDTTKAVLTRNAAYKWDGQIWQPMWNDGLNGVATNGLDYVAVGALYDAATTNQLNFGATNTPPSGTSTPTKWISVRVQGETVAYRLPVYQ